MSFLNDLRVKGRFPPVEMRIAPLTPRRASRRAPKTVVVDNFLSYNFNTSMLIPVDNFSYTFSAPGDDRPFTDYALEGDIVTLTANNTLIGTGIVDQIEIECDGDTGERVTINGRNLLGQLEDQSAVSLNMSPIYASMMPVIEAIEQLLQGTRLPKKVVNQDSSEFTTLIATEAGETKLSAILRILEPVNSLVWAGPDGTLIVGKPDFSQGVTGKLMLNKKKRTSNVLSMRAVRSATSIPSRYVACWTALEESVQNRLQKNRIYSNTAEGPARLFREGHTNTKTVVSSITTGADAAGADNASRIIYSEKKGTTVLDQMIFRQMAKDNFNELLVTCVMAGHCDENGYPFIPDSVYNIEYDRAGIQENMYLYSVEYQGNDQRGQWTILNFCKLGTIVEGSKINA